MPLLQAQGPRDAVAKFHGQRQTMLAGLAVRMDPADVALLVDPEICIGRDELATGHLSDARRKAPKERGHRRIFEAVNFDGGLGQQAVAANEGARTVKVEILLNAAAECL